MTPAAVWREQIEPTLKRHAAAWLRDEQAMSMLVICLAIVLFGALLCTADEQPSGAQQTREPRCELGQRDHEHARASAAGRGRMYSCFWLVLGGTALSCAVAIPFMVAAEARRGSAVRSMPMKVPDPLAAKPDGWDEAEDGAWQAPMMPNPEYEAARKELLQHRIARATDKVFARALAALRRAGHQFSQSSRALIVWAKSNPTLAACGAGTLSLLVLAYLIWRIPDDDVVQGVPPLKKAL